MFHRHHHKTAATTPVAAVPVATTGLVTSAPTLVPVAPAPPGPILAVPLVAYQQVPAAAPAAPVQQAAGLLNKVKNALPDPSTISNAVKKTADTVMPSSDTTVPTEAHLIPMNAPVSMAPVAPPLSENLRATSFSDSPVNFLKEERPAVVRERIIPIEEENIQPVIHREVERREIHEVVQPIHERQVLPATVEEKQLQAEYRPTIGGYAPRQATSFAPSVEYATPERTQIVRPPIIEETIRKTIIEEVQPIIHREVVKPHIIRQTQPIYEKILEPEVILKETRPMIEKELGTSTWQTRETLPTWQTQQALPSSGQFTQQPFGNKYQYEIDQTTKLSPVGAKLETTGQNWQQQQTVYRGYPGSK